MNFRYLRQKYFSSSAWKERFHRIRRSLGFLLLAEKVEKEFLKSQPTDKELEEIYKGRLEKNKQLRSRRDFSLDELKQIDEAASVKRGYQQAKAQRTRDLFAIQDKSEPVINEFIQKIDKMVSEACGEDWVNIRKSIGELREKGLIYGDEAHWMFEEVITGDPERVPETIEEILLRIDSDPNKDVVNLRNFIISVIIDKMGEVFSQPPDQEVEAKMWIAESTKVEKIVPSKELQLAIMEGNSLVNWFPESLKKLILEGKPIPADILNKGLEEEMKARKLENSESQTVKRIENRQ